MSNAKGHPGANAGAVAGPRQEQRTAPRLDALWVGLAFLVFYEWLRQMTIPGDGTTLLDLASREHLPSDNHFLYLPLAYALRSLLMPIGLSTFDILSQLSCFSAAIGVGLTHVGLRILRFSRIDAAIAAGLVGFAPGLAFYGTSVELHAPFFAIAGVAFIAAARVAAAPGVGRAMVLGLATGVAYSAHATGALLPLPLLAVAVAGARNNPNVRLSFAQIAKITIAVAAVHTACVWGIPWVLREVSEQFVVDPANNQRWIENNAAGGWKELHLAFVTTWNEWLIPAAPMCVAWMCGFAIPQLRLLALGLAVSFLPYLGISYVLLAAHSERGAYLLPLYWLASWLTVRSLPRAVSAGLVVIAAAVSIWFVKSHDDPNYSREFAKGIREIAADAPLVVFTGIGKDVGACFSHLPDAVTLRLPVVAMDGEPAVRALMPQLDVFLATWYAEGRRVFITAEVQEALAPGAFAGAEVLDRVIMAHLRSTYDLVPVRSSGFDGFEVTTK